MVLHPLLLAQDRIEALHIEITVVDLMPARSRISTHWLCRAAPKLEARGLAYKMKTRNALLHRSERCSASAMARSTAFLRQQP